MNGEFVRFFYKAAAGYVANTADEIALYDALGGLRTMSAGDRLWLTDVATIGATGGLGLRCDWLYDDPDNSGRTDANTICEIRGSVVRLRRVGFSHPCPVRRLMTVADGNGVTAFWWGHGLIRSA